VRSEAEEEEGEGGEKDSRCGTRDEGQVRSEAEGGREEEKEGRNGREEGTGD
jgi:hypothetical protein